MTPCLKDILHKVVRAEGVLLLVSLEVYGRHRLVVNFNLFKVFK